MPFVSQGELRIAFTVKEIELNATEASGCLWLAEVAEDGHDIIFNEQERLLYKRCCWFVPEIVNQ